ncbi:hypothetical protein HDA32_004633 [Spinactinospora alkalitolerans]|uniref:DUF2637 domain-containing protein n=1 Tax=Spinactinospora alkalitolerans TaxID=687207 RepID=A0A852U3L6_9ACTN|nr:hypothetical protein [Spinactinospora alkalitolerans]NYE49513.1 hypothetical protein [Spinactinospora alkalitolerans]
MIIASSMALLTDARHGRRGGVLPWTLLVLGSAASLAANVAVADPTLWPRVIHAWPSFALMGAYELLMREFRASARGVRTAIAGGEQPGPIGPIAEPEPVRADDMEDGAVFGGEQRRSRLRVVEAPSDGRERVDAAAGDLSEAVPRIQVEAWRWALDNRRDDGSLPSGKEIAARFNRKDRWGRLVKQWGQQGRFEEKAPALPESGIQQGGYPVWRKAGHVGEA